MQTVRIFGLGVGEGVGEGMGEGVGVGGTVGTRHAALKSRIPRMTSGAAALEMADRRLRVVPNFPVPF